MVLRCTIDNLYHGSPYKFKKFADEKIGSGEGAQSFGHGHYLTESEDIAKGYSKDRVYRSSLFSHASKNRPDIINEIRKWLDDTYQVPNDEQVSRVLYDINARKDVSLPDKFIQKVKDAFKNVSKEHVYETSAFPGRETPPLLEWDKPVGVISKAIDKVSDTWGEHGQGEPCRRIEVGSGGRLASSGRCRRARAPGPRWVTP